jgi:hypothetical protein
LQRKRSLAGSGIAFNQIKVAAGQASEQDVVESLDAGSRSDRFLRGSFVGSAHPILALFGCILVRWRKKQPPFPENGEKQCSVKVRTQVGPTGWFKEQKTGPAVKQIPIRGDILAPFSAVGRRMKKLHPA